MNDKISSTGMTYLQAIFDQSADGLMICDHDGVILKLNSAAEKLNGVKASDLVGKDVVSLVKEGRIDRSATKEVIDSKRQVSVIQKSPNSEYTLLVTGTPVFDDNNNICFVVINERDISLIESMKKELMLARQESESIKNELTQLNLLELKENNIVAQSNSMKQTLRLALKLAVIKASNILIQGESGTGKGLLAKFIHQHYSRQKKPFIQINCAALPENLLEAELFGYEKGAFTGAQYSRKGRIEMAEGGTLFLDEIGDISKKTQIDLLRVLQEKAIYHLGSTRPIKIDVRIISATNKNLEEAIKDGSFREDLYYRLNIVTINIPPLKERKEDIPLLANYFFQKFTVANAKKITGISGEAMKALIDYDWPGNVRELENAIERAVVVSKKKEIILDDLPETISIKAIAIESEPRSLNEFEKKQILQVLNENDWNISKSAKELKIDRGTLYNKLKKYNIKR